MRLCDQLPVLCLCAAVACEAPADVAVATPPAAVLDDDPVLAEPVTLAAAQPSFTPAPIRSSAPRLTPSPPPPQPDVRVVFQGPPDERRIALTFDDGPSAQLTPRVLDVLQYYDVHATFFVLGHRAKEHPQLLRRIAAEGHDLGSHGWSHRSFRGLFHSQIRNELENTAALIEDAAGAPPRYVRPPFGKYADSATAIFADLGLHVVLWTIDSRDWENEPGKTVEAIVREARPGSIVLLHDREPATLRALPQIIGSLHGRGFELVTVSELIGG